MNQSLTGYDIIGDIHGHAEELKMILQKMGYSFKNHIWRHPERKAIFVGDYIDRGPDIRETLFIVKNMVDAGAALAIMGNHEYNALAYSYHNLSGGFIREHNDKNSKQHSETIRQFMGHKKEWDEYLAWFANLPLFLELDNIRIVHACWDDENIDYLKTVKGPLTKEILLEAHNKKSGTWKIYEETLKGKEIRLPDGHYFTDKDNNKRTECRTKWWLNPEGLSLQEFLFHAPVSVEELRLSSENNNRGYSPKEPAVFFGHYWLDAKDGPKLQAPNVCCLDYSVAKEGILAAYRYYHDQPISEVNFVTIESLN